MTDACTLPRKAELKDTPHPLLDDETKRQRGFIQALDLDGCNVVYVIMAMNEFERDKLTGLRFDQWPDTIRARMAKEVATWEERNPGGAIKGVTQGVNNGNCVLALHWRPTALPA